jgi:hypothetical protein
MIPVLHLALIRLAERVGWNTIPPAIELTGAGADAASLPAHGIAGSGAAPR